MDVSYQLYFTEQKYSVPDYLPNIDGIYSGIYSIDENSWPVNIYIEHNNIIDIYIKSIPELISTMYIKNYMNNNYYLDLLDRAISDNFNDIYIYNILYNNINKFKNIDIKHYIYSMLNKLINMSVNIPSIIFTKKLKYLIIVAGEQFLFTNETMNNIIYPIDYIIRNTSNKSIEMTRLWMSDSILWSYEIHGLLPEYKKISARIIQKRFRELYLPDEIIDIILSYGLIIYNAPEKGYILSEILEMMNVYNMSLEDRIDLGLYIKQHVPLEYRRKAFVKINIDKEYLGNQHKYFQALVYMNNEIPIVQQYINTYIKFKNNMIEK